jgi:hypothetical protein
MLPNQSNPSYKQFFTAGQATIQAQVALMRIVSAHRSNGVVSMAITTSSALAIYISLSDTPLELIMHQIKLLELSDPSMGNTDMYDNKNKARPFY